MRLGLGQLYFQGDTVEKNIETAFRYLKEACQGGEAQICFAIASDYRKGELVSKNLKQAAVFFEKACEAGEARGCYLRGNAYMKGEGSRRISRRLRRILSGLVSKTCCWAP